MINTCALYLSMVLILLALICPVFGNVVVPVCSASQQSVFAATPVNVGIVTANPGSSDVVIGYCLPIGNNIPAAIGTVRMDTYYGAPDCCGPEKRSQDPVPACSSGEICDGPGYAVGSWYWIAAWLTDSAGNVLCDKKTLYFKFNSGRPRETINYDSTNKQCYWTCSDGAC